MSSDWLSQADRLQELRSKLFAFFSQKYYGVVIHYFLVSRRSILSTEGSIGMPSLKPFCLLCQNQGSLRHQRVILLVAEKNVPPHP